MGEQLILTHENTDFDALASQLAVWKLYPQARPVLPRRPNRNVRDFCTIYGDELPFVRYEDLPRRIEIDRIFLVDTQTLVTPKGMTDDTEVQIIDHHPLGRELSLNWSYAGEEVGATTTLLVERLVALGHSLTPVEATLFTLGIYEDTGSLTYPTTTVRDLRCVAWLAEHGANLTVVSEFLHHGLTDPQLDLYNALLDHVEIMDVAGHSIVMTTATAEGYVEEISTLAHKIRDLYDPAGLFLIVDLGQHIQLVGRSATDAVDVGHIATHFGGGGHTRAAAALIHDQDLASVRSELVELLDQHIHPSVTVRQIMSYGVQTLPAETTVDEAAEEMLRYGFEGFPVVDDAGHILGVLTRREIDRARRLHLGNMPVLHYMTKGDISVTPDDSVERLQQVMTQFGVGQVPVVSGGEILGVVTRTDLIKLWAAPAHTPSRRRDIVQRIEATLPGPLLALLRLASNMAQEMGYPLYVVGGFVRDLLLSERNLDMDLVVEGNAIRLARRVAREIGAGTRSHGQFGTAKIVLEGREEEFGIPSLDFATARLEFYAHSAALPEVESSSIKADLHRRDFTINTLAIRLDSDHYGRLLDFYGGEEDLRRGLIQVLHSLSFIEDPTRIMRAARFEQRLGFQIEARTAELIENALPMLSRVSAERLRHELYLILAEAEPERALERLDELGVLPHIHPSLWCAVDTATRFKTLRQAVADPAWDVRRTETGAPAAGLYLSTWLYDLSPEEMEAVGAQLKPFRQDMELLREVAQLRSRAARLDPPELSNAAIFALLRRTSSEARLITWLCAASEPNMLRARERLLLYQTSLQNVTPVIDGTYLKSLGLKPSPLFRHLLDEVRDARLNGEIETAEEEKALIARRLAERQEHD